MEVMKKDPGEIDWQRYYNTTSGKASSAAPVSTQPSAMAASNRAPSSVKKAGFMDYVDAFNQGMYNITAPFVAHPIDAAIDVVKNTGIFAWDMGNAITGVSLHVSTEGSRMRNAARWEAFSQDVIYGDGLSRTEWATEMIGGAILTGGVGSATGLVLREGIAATRASRMTPVETTLALEPAMAEVPTISKGTTKWGTASAEQVIANRMTSTVSKLGLFGNRTVGAEGALNLASKNHISGLRLQQQLANEEIATLFKSNGELTQVAIENSRRIPLKINNPTLKSTLSKRDGNLSDWGKYETTPVHTESGLARMHFYHNPKTGDVFYGRDYKAIYDHQGKWDNELQRNFTMQP